MSTEEDSMLSVDPKKRKRMISNRESARRSRMRKQQRLDDLIKQGAELKEENNRIMMQLNLYHEQYLKVDSENVVLRREMMELTNRLQSLNSVLRFIEEFSGMEMDIPEMPVLEPWQVSCPVQPITASADMFQF